MGKLDFQPIILGSDENAYAVARAFHEEYGIKSVVVTENGMLATMHSKIVEIINMENIEDPSTFVNKMNNLRKQIESKAEKFILIASNENYAELCIRNKGLLEENFLLPFVDEALLDELIFKENFYNLCEKSGLDYPATVIFEKEMEIGALKLPFDFPIVVKPSNTVTYFTSQFQGKEKAYIIHDQETLVETVKTIYSSTYEDSLIIQDYIPGRDDAMYVINAYVDQHSKVRLMSLGHVVLEDCTPILLGNYVAITTDYNEEIFQTYTKFLEDINFKGFANIDLKYDKRDGKFKIFELNIRQGRSNYFVTASGNNLMKPMVDDLVYEKSQKAPNYTKGDVLWHNAPLKVVKRYIFDEKLKEKVFRQIKEKKTSRTLFYHNDFNLIRNLKLHNFYRVYHSRFQKYFKHDKK